MDAYAGLDDGSERTILLHPAAQQLDLKGGPEDLPLRTVRQELQILHWAVVFFTIASAAELHRVFFFFVPNLYCKTPKLHRRNLHWL